jgi:hypothetical protein
MTLNYAQLIDGISLSVDPAAPANSVNLDSSGRLLVGTSSAISNFNFEVASNSTNTSIGVFTYNNAGVPKTLLSRANGTQSSPTSVTINQDLGQHDFRGYDGSSFFAAARIEAEVDGTPGANDMPGRIVFSTTASGSATPTERMRLTSNGYLRLASGVSGIQFNGDTAAANALDDYEEGSWTPRWQLAGVNAGGTYDANLTGGWYIKVGAIVHAWCRVAYSVNGTSTSGALRMSGLPFQMGFAATGVSITPITACTLWFNRTNTQVPGLIAGRIDNIGTTVELMDQDSAGQQNILDGSAVLQGSFANEFAMYVCYSTSL